MKNPYEELGVPEDANDEDIRRAYRQRAKQAHPDAGGNAAEFASLSRAMTLLLDPVQRKKFDDFGHVDENTSNIESMAMEQVVSFISNSIQATLDNNVSIQGLDFIKGGKLWCEQRIAELRNYNRRFQRQIELHEKIKKRLHTVRKNDPVSRMLAHQIRELKVRIEGNEKQIEVTTCALKIFGDYTLLPDPDERVTTHQVPPGFFGAGTGPYTGR